MVEQLDNLRKLTEILQIIKDDVTANEAIPHIREVVIKARKNKKIPLAEQSRLMGQFKEEMESTSEGFEKELSRISKLKDGKMIVGKILLAIRN